MKHIIRKGMSLLLIVCMLLGLLPQLPQHAAAASNIVGTFEGQAADVFSALGFDTSVLPEGYDAETTDNPYGRDRLPGIQVFEAHIASATGSKTVGDNDNGKSLKDTGGLPGNSAGVPLDMFAVAAGDFDGDGLAGEAVYVGFLEDEINWGEYSGLGDAMTNLYLMVYDGKTAAYSDRKTLSAVSPLTSAPDEKPMYDYLWQNLLQVTAGDWDGDGTAEIAVYVAENGANRVDIYKYQKTSQSPADGWLAGHECLEPCVEPRGQQHRR